LKSAKKCVTTYLPNELALKIDGAKAYYLYFTVETKKNLKKSSTSRCTWRLLRSFPREGKCSIL